MSVAAARRHQCMIYDGSPSRMLTALAATARQRLAAHARFMYINSPSMVAGFRSQLYAAGTDVESEISRGALVLIADVAHLVNGRFDVDRMIDMLEAAVLCAVADGYAGLFATGDMSWEFGSEKELSKLLEYEWRLERLFQEQAALSGVCQYHRDLLPPEAVREGLLSHASVYVNDTISRLNPHYAPARSPHERTAVASPQLDEALEAILAPEL